jgi:phosphoglucomutase
MSEIKFGTDGWRAKMGKDFSFKNVRIFAKSYANFLKKRKKAKKLRVIVNFDTRFLSKKFALETARILSLEKISTYMPDRDVPLAPISLAIIRNAFIGGINITASFSKPIYNGIKVFSSRGVPALPSETFLIEKEIEKISESYVFEPQYADNDMINSIDVQAPYIDYLENLIDFKGIKDSGLKIIVDNLYGTSREYLDYVLGKNGIDIQTIHNFPNSPFEGVISSCDKESLKELSELVIENKADIGLATDIDGDRFGIIDSRGRFITANYIMPPLIEYLITVRKMAGGIVKSVSATNNIKNVAEYYGREVYTTPVGFKYLADVLSAKKAFIAVESSNGASLNSTVNVKDGILFSLLVAEMLAYYKMNIKEIAENFAHRFPRLYNIEVAFRKSGFREKNYKKLLTKDKKKYKFKPFKLHDIDFLDGIKFIFEEGWLLIRASGTSDTIRLYAEANVLKKTKDLIKIGRDLIEKE